MTLTFAGLLLDIVTGFGVLCVLLTIVVLMIRTAWNSRSKKNDYIR